VAIFAARVTLFCRVFFGVPVCTVPWEGGENLLRARKRPSRSHTRQPKLIDLSPAPPAPVLLRAESPGNGVQDLVLMLP